MPELMAARSSFAYLFTWWKKRDWSNSNSQRNMKSVPLLSLCGLTFSGDPDAIFPSPRTANMRTVQLGSEILSIMLFIRTSISISSVTTWWFKSWDGQICYSYFLWHHKTINDHLRNKIIEQLHHLREKRSYSYSLTFIDVVQGGTQTLHHGRQPGTRMFSHCPVDNQKIHNDFFRLFFKLKSYIFPNLNTIHKKHFYLLI